MIDSTVILGLCTFGVVASVGYFITTVLGNSQETERLRSRLKSNEASPQSAIQTPSVPLLMRLGQAAARPFMPKTREKISGARKNLAYAGIYSPSAVKTLYGFKFIFLFVGFFGGYFTGLLTDSLFLWLPLGSLLGIFTPVIWLKQRIKANQRALDYGLPDALDLTVVCVEAGLTVDAAMQRVGQELALVHPALSRELSITHMETRVGLSRVESLRNLGARTGSASLQSLAAMLAQAERFGTSIAQALRVHAESLRLARQNQAESMASKTAVKLTFPLVLFIFPATFLVLIGPTAIHLMDSPLFK